MIDIVIPINENVRSINKLLHSIAMQTEIDNLTIYLIFNKITNECNKEIDAFESSINFKLVETYKNLHGEYLIEETLKNTKSKFLLFLDTNSMLYNAKSVEFMKRACSHDADFIIGSMYSQRLNKVIKNYYTLAGNIYDRSMLEQEVNNYCVDKYYGECRFNCLLLDKNYKAQEVTELTYFCEPNYEVEYAQRQEINYKDFEEEIIKENDNFIEKLKEIWPITRSILIDFVRKNMS